MKKRILLGVSSCLLGEKVRFDGGHKRDNYICDLLSHYVDFLPICPEVAIGMGIPRPAIRLIGDSGSPRLVEVKNHQRDYTQPMLDFANETMKTLTPISGYILKSKSPTCGLKRGENLPGKRASAAIGGRVICQCTEKGISLFAH
ncbi:DUF523 domain-containing protein [Legionella feeleii]|uniref:Uncharacterized conserved protein n=1 Tax=Legionella feeleii TaxID=453 RepID=A0A378IR16_9GAMM|nr:DUF523 domain-containing protein [Legionella feeleii]STX37302.1 Uncharacterized conserved protein [Legionella feeleii]